jgi:hypothetical protein
MTTYTHKMIAEAIAALDQAPADTATFDEWIRAGRHLDYLQVNAKSDEIIVHASGPCSFIYSIAVPSEALVSEHPEALLKWSDNPFKGIASYVWGGGRDTAWIERGGRERGSLALNAGIDLIFGRTFEGWSGPDRSYFEVNQEYTHLSDIHWRRERSAYCRFDKNGDLADLVSITPREKREAVSLVTFTWAELDEYLGIARYALVRMFDFTLLRHGQFGGWNDGPEDIVKVSEELLYRQKVVTNAAYTRGVQIIHPRDARTTSPSVSERWGGSPKREYVTFITEDWRHNRVTEISTDPSATTNYFEADKNTCPLNCPRHFSGRRFYQNTKPTARNIPLATESSGAARRGRSEPMMSTTPGRSLRTSVIFATCLTTNSFTGNRLMRLRRRAFPKEPS